MRSSIKIIFMGTASFAVPSLEKLVQSGYTIAGVITAPDRPSGRGKKIKHSPVKEFALNNGLKVLQPANLKDESFLLELEALQPDIQVVVAFRMLPDAVWKLPPLGTINLHASLLPQYRGAAPINHAIFNGEKRTGVTTFYIDDKIDTGMILKQAETEIGDNETAGTLHDRLMVLGADLVSETVHEIVGQTIHPVNQNELLNRAGHIHPAPKIFKEDCRINWDDDMEKINNQIRGLSPYPGAFTILNLNEGASKSIKLFNCEKISETPTHLPGHLRLRKASVDVACKNGYLSLIEIQLEGKRKMDIHEFLRGFSMDDGMHMM